MRAKRITRVGLLVALGVGVLSCSSHVGLTQPTAQADAGAPPHPTASSPEYTSGTRLRAHVLDGGGGAAYLLDWMDTQLGILCTFRVAQDGVVRCLPETRLTVFFADAACTTAVTVPLGPSPGFFYTSANNSVGTNASLCPSIPPTPWSFPLPAPDGEFAVDESGSPLVDPPQLYWEIGGPCTLDPNPSDPRAPYYPVHPVAPSTFVAASESHEARTAELSVRVLSTDDGARQAAGLFDEQRAAPCRPSTEITSTFEQDDSCIPYDTADANLFAGWPCTMPYAYLPSGCPMPTSAVELRPRGSCPARPTVWGIDPQSPRLSYGSILSAVTQTSSGACQYGCGNVDGCDGVHEFYATNGSPLGGLPSAPLVPIGGPPLRLFLRGVDDGTPAVQDPPQEAPGLAQGDPQWLDVQRNEVCRAAFVDGWRCVPPFLSLSSPSSDRQFFADAQCSQELADAGTLTAPCSAPTMAVRAGSPPEVHALGALVTPTQVYVGGNSSCSLQQSGGFFYVVGPEMNVTFPALTESVE